MVSPAGRRLAGYGAHAFTAAGAALGFLALAFAAERAFAAMFAALGVAFVIDGVDGALARALDVPVTAPAIDGATLDLVIDFTTYVAAPLLALQRADLMPAAWSLALGALASAASALYFADRRMKTPDLWFRGFPACWNVVAFYLFTLRPPALVCALVLLLGVGLLFAPFASVHPLRVRRLRGATLAASALWLSCAAWIVATDFGPAAAPKLGLVAAGAYFIGLSMWRGVSDPSGAPQENHP